VKYIVQDKTIDIDLGDKQILIIRKPGFAKFATMAKGDTDNITLLINLIVDSTENWAGFVDDKNKPVEFSKETLQALLQSLNADEFNTFTAEVIKVLLPSEKDLKKKETELKNLKSTTKK
jgi:hypothetical protein